MISIELLGEVLDASVYELKIKGNTVFAVYDNGMPLMNDIPINIYELAHKCKEWAHSRNFMIQSYLYNTKARADLLSSCDVDEKFIADTEPEAIFKACEWILKAKR